ncbi:hypothetical protein KPL76_00460 [Subtercola sp. PAMC28395]|uniref:hypothetical protein n=1 Tax=Subtercola sp. PAMC28395 TaxID=2846775 RepID=UPI001C0DDD62|nr:hypothetical protein [Subtercola sp. PAMC28395]QWT23962.1 hypothetical protein KPL76_00460 [Subtercola sp. PAMC28395]
MSSRAARTVRGLTAACFATFVAAFSHVAVGGSAPGAVGLAVGLAFATLVCVALAGRSLSTLRLSIAVGLSQLVFHLVFSLGASSDLSVAQLGHHGMLSVATDSGAAGIASSSQGGADALMQGCSWMWAAHAVAAVVTVVALARGESAIRVLYSTAALRLRAVMTLPFLQPVPAVSPYVAGAEPEPSHLRDLGIYLGSLRHRGPPTPLFAAQ